MRKETENIRPPGKKEKLMETQKRKYTTKETEKAEKLGEQKTMREKIDTIDIILKEYMRKEKNIRKNKEKEGKRKSLKRAKKKRRKENR